MLQNFIRLAAIETLPYITQNQADLAIATLISFYGAKNEQIIYEKGFPELIRTYTQLKFNILSKVRDHI